MTLPRNEHAEQCAVIEFCERLEFQHPELALLFAIPNGAKLPYNRDAKGRRYSPQAQKLKAEGMRAGVPDLCLPVARHGFLSLWIEMKDGNNKPTPAQVKFMEALTKEGHLAVVCWGALEAIEALKDYLGVE